MQKEERERERKRERIKVSAKITSRQKLTTTVRFCSFLIQIFLLLSGALEWPSGVAVHRCLVPLQSVLPGEGHRAPGTLVRGGGGALLLRRLLLLFKLRTL